MVSSEAHTCRTDRMKKCSRLGGLFPWQYEAKVQLNLKDTGVKGRALGEREIALLMCASLTASECSIAA